MKILVPNPIKPGRNVWLGANVTILGRVTTGDSAVVAAGAVVTLYVPANTITAGVPARVVATTDVSRHMDIRSRS